MFLFSKKHKTPVSTYTDSYCPPCSVKKTIQDNVSREFWKENNFVTEVNATGRGNLGISTPSQLWILSARQREGEQSGCPPASSAPQDTPVYCMENNMENWRTTPFSSTAWNKHCSCLSRLPKETRMETYLYRVPMMHPPKPTCLNPCEREAIATTLRRLSCPALPSLQPVYTMSTKGAFQGYYSPCSGRHYCLQGMDYYVDRDPAIRKHLNALAERPDNSMLQLQPWSSSLDNCPLPPAILLIPEP
ncbi:Spermatid-specific manchette-related protein 1 [Mesitornis unicolor]|uniref:Spermatid-specific manchette-related protein 1 n=1 Tax=Mesitornis unicolor TaxID=54374 RepID=A0A091SGQ6_9AVES|nr:Spermatid-specific manchette-related protein 1 [Mesitornis unicolor]